MAESQVSQEIIVFLLSDWFKHLSISWKNDGLYFNVTPTILGFNGDYIIDSIFICNDFNLVIEWLDLDIDLYKSGFKSTEDVTRWIKNSKQVISPERKFFLLEFLLHTYPHINSELTNIKHNFIRSCFNNLLGYKFLCQQFNIPQYIDREPSKSLRRQFSYIVNDFISNYSNKSLSASVMKSEFKKKFYTIYE